MHLTPIKVPSPLVWFKSEQLNHLSSEMGFPVFYRGSAYDAADVTFMSLEPDRYIGRANLSVGANCG